METPALRDFAHHVDLAVVRRALTGDLAAREDVLAWLSRVPGMIRVRARHASCEFAEDELADVTQEAFAVIWRKLDRYEGRSSFSSWVYGIGALELRKAEDRRERAQREVRLGTELDDLPAAELPCRLDLGRIERELDVLDTPVRRIIRMKHFEGLTFEELGLRLELPVGTVKTMYYRGMERLKARLMPARRGDSA